jgi:glycosyltransferase involved in cell wall biosynthesis
LKVWVVTIGEPVPSQEARKERLHRTGEFAFYLAERGHQVTWWTSTFNHFEKKHLFASDHTIIARSNLTISLLHGCGYRGNVSFSRILDHRQIARKFSQAAPSCGENPDVIVAALPALEICWEAVKFGRRRGIPVLVDVRDLWPDIFVAAVPAPLRPFSKFLLSGMQRTAVHSLVGANGIMAISESYLRWALDKAGRDVAGTDCVLPLGYTLPEASETEIEEASKELKHRGVDPSKMICWFIGTFGRSYDLAPIIRAARKLMEAGNQNMQFVLAGTGEREAEWKKKAMGLSNVIFTGWVRAAQIRWLGSVASLGLAAYAKGAPQSLPNKLFEYFAAGLPVLSTLAGDTATLLEKEACGYTCPVEDEKTLLKLLTLLETRSDLRHSMGQKARQLFESRYSTKILYPQMESYLQKAIDDYSS